MLTDGVIPMEERPKNLQKTDDLLRIKKCETIRATTLDAHCFALYVK